MPNEAKWGGDLGPERLPVRGKLVLSLQLWREGGNEQLRLRSDPSRESCDEWPMATF